MIRFYHLLASPAISIAPFLSRVYSWLRTVKFPRGLQLSMLIIVCCHSQQLVAQACNQLNDFSGAITIGPTQAPGVWYTDRYAPAVFSSPHSIPGETVLIHSISMADGAINRPGGQQGSFYNTQGRKYDLPAMTKSMKIDLFIPAAWATSDKREAGFWGTAVDGASAISAFPIIEFTSDGSNPRFRGWESGGAGAWSDLGLPSGFVYDAWYTLEIELLASGEFLYTVGDLQYTTTTSAPDASVRIDNVILQGHNYDPTHMGTVETDPGVTYDIFWDNFINNIPKVQNISTTEVFCSIQDAIDDADTDNGDIIQIAEGTYQERVVIDKELTLQGSAADKTLYILDGSSLIGPGNGITIASGTENVTIKNLTVQNYTGTNGNSNAGIYGIGGNNHLMIDAVSLLNNTGGSGFYANGPVDGVTIQNSMVSNHGPGSRGIVIWNGFKQNILFHNNMVVNNNCCGIELQDGTASAVTVTQNTVDIGSGDNAIGLMGMGMSAGPNLVDGNVVTGGGRYGIEIKNPNGGISVTNNNVSLTTQNADLRDRAGIAVFRRSILSGNPDGHPDVPHGVTLIGNTVDGYKQTSGEEGYGIVVEGTSHTVNGNMVNNNDIGIQFQGGGHANSNYVENNAGDGDQAVGQSPNYFGRGNSPLVCNVDLGVNSFTSNGVDLRLVTETQNTTTPGVVMAAVQGQFHNLVQDTYHCSLQDAIDNASNDDVIEISDGDFPENVIINLPLTIQSVNGKLNTSIQGDGSTPTITITSDDVIIDGLTLTNVGGANAIYSNNQSDIIVKNCRVMNVGSGVLSGTPVHAVLFEASANPIDNIQILG